MAARGRAGDASRLSQDRGRGRRPPDDAGSSGRRLFVGVPLPDDAARAIADVVEGVRATALPAGARDVRWVRLDGLHLTLRFLGPTEPDQLAPTLAAVAAAARSVAGPIDIELAGAGTFPAGRRPRTLWVGLSHGADGLRELAASTEAALVEAGWAAEGRPFRPHLTLARSDGIGAGALVADRLANAMAGRRIQGTVDTLGLFESITGGGPARYLPVALHRLGPSPDPSDRVYHHRAPDTSGRSPGST